MTTNPLSHALVIDRTTLTQNLCLLRTAGLVRFDASQSGREQRVMLTPVGGTRTQLTMAPGLPEASSDGTLTERVSYS